MYTNCFFFQQQPSDVVFNTYERGVPKISALNAENHPFWLSISIPRECLSLSTALYSGYASMSLSTSSSTSSSSSSSSSSLSSSSACSTITRSTFLWHPLNRVRVTQNPLFNYLCRNYQSRTYVFVTFHPSHTGCPMQLWIWMYICMYVRTYVRSNHPRVKCAYIFIYVHIDIYIHKTTISLKNVLTTRLLVLD